MALKLHAVLEAQDGKVAVRGVAFERSVVDLEVPLSLFACLKSVTEASASWSGTSIGSGTVYILKSGANAPRLVLVCGTKQLFEYGANADLADRCCKRIRREKFLFCACVSLRMV